MKTATKTMQYDSEDGEMRIILTVLPRDNGEELKVFRRCRDEFENEYWLKAVIAEHTLKRAVITLIKEKFKR